MAALASLASPYGTRSMTDSVPGSTRSHAVPAAAPTHSPLMSCIESQPDWLAAFVSAAMRHTPFSSCELFGAVVIDTLRHGIGTRFRRVLVLGWRQCGDSRAVRLTEHGEAFVDLVVTQVQRRQQSDAVRVEPGPDDDEAAGERLFGDGEHQVGVRLLGVVLHEL